MKTKLLKTTFLTLVLASILQATLPAHDAHAQATAPASQASASKLVLDSSSRLLATLESRRTEFKSNPTALNKFVSTELDQVFDRDYAARLVLGVHGRGAAEGDIKLFADAMSDNLLQRYGSALLDFNSKLKVRVKSETALPGNRGVRVATEMTRPDGDPIPVDYLMRQVGGQWKIFDVMVEGVSFVQTFRTQFDAPLRQKSIAQVAADLRGGRIQADAGL